MKLKFLVLCTLFFFSCQTVVEKTKKNLIYFKDERTNLCFGIIDNKSSVSITCVPCDSLKNIELNKKLNYLK